MEKDKRQDDQSYEIDEEQLLLTMLKRSLEDFALRPEGDKWFESASNWLFGESRILFKGDDRVANFTLDDICYYFGNKKPSKVREVALTMRRFKLNMKQFTEMYWGQQDEENDSYEKTFEGEKVRVVWSKSSKGTTTVRVKWSKR